MSDSRDELVRNTADLARLEISPEEVARLGGQFARILEQFEGLAALDLDGVEPTTGATQLVDVRRKDVPAPGLERDALLRNAPRREGDFFAVPKTLGGEG